MVGDVPVTIAGTAIAWVERTAERHFDVSQSGRLRSPIPPFPKGNTGPKGPRIARDRVPTRPRYAPKETL